MQRTLKIVARTFFVSFLMVPVSVIWLIHGDADWAPGTLAIASLSVMTLSFATFVVLGILEARRRRRRRSARDESTPSRGALDAWGVTLIASIWLSLASFLVGCKLGGFVVACGTPTDSGVAFILLSLALGLVATIAFLVVVIRWLVSFWRSFSSRRSGEKA